MTNEELVKGLRQNALWVTTHEAADRIEQLEREAILDAKLLADTQALLDMALEAVIDAKLVAEAKLNTALEAVIDAKLVAEAKVQALEAERDAAIAALEARND